MCGIVGDTGSREAGPILLEGLPPPPPPPPPPAGERGHRLVSETDTETIAHLVEEAYGGDIGEAVRRALRRVEGAYAVAVMHRDEPERIVGARPHRPLVVGAGKDENF